MNKAVRLCNVTDIPDSGAKGVEVGQGADALDLILLRCGEKVFAYENRCPQRSMPLETFPDKFLDESCKLLYTWRALPGARRGLRGGSVQGGITEAYPRGSQRRGSEALLKSG